MAPSTKKKTCDPCDLCDPGELCELSGRVEGDGRHVAGGEEELCVSDPRAGAADGGADGAGERPPGHQGAEASGSLTPCLPAVTSCPPPPVAQSEKDRAKVAELQETVEQQTKTIKRFNRGQRSHAQHAQHTHTKIKNAKQQTNSIYTYTYNHIYVHAYSIIAVVLSC